MSQTGDQLPKLPKPERPVVTWIFGVDRRTAMLDADLTDRERKKRGVIRGRREQSTSLNDPSNVF